MKTPFNEEFCTQLEYRICAELEKSTDLKLKGFWCDGVSWNPIPNNQLSKKSINDTRQIVTKAWIGKDGQDEYEMIIQLGRNALRRYASGTEIIDCIPGSDTLDWIDIDPDNLIIELRLK